MVLSLEGVQISSSPLSGTTGSSSISVDDDDGASVSLPRQQEAFPTQRVLLVSAQTGFRTTFPPECVHVSSPQYSTLFPLHEGNLLTVKSQEETIVVANDEEAKGNNDGACCDKKHEKLVNMNIVLHWRGDEEDDASDSSSNSNSNCGNEKDVSPEEEEEEEGVNNKRRKSLITHIPHLEIMLPSRTTPSNHASPSMAGDECGDKVHELPSSPSSTTTLPDVIEFHVCVTVTPSATSDDRMTSLCMDENGISDFHNEEDTQQGHWIPPLPSPPSSINHHGIAHLKLSPAELQNTDEATTPLSYGRPGGKVVVLPIRKKDDVFPYRSAAISNDDFKNLNEAMQSQSQQALEIVKFTRDAVLFVRVERVCVPNVHHSKKMEQQCHYVECIWENGDSCAPASIMHHDDEVKTIKESAYKEDSSSSWLKIQRSLFASTSSNKKLPTTGKCHATLLEHTHLREESTTPINLAAAMAMVGREDHAYHNSSAVAGANRNAQSTTSNINNDQDHYPLKNSLSFKNIREKILCGASLPDLSETVKLVIEAGQHCDEDHGGLYVMSSNSFGGSSIATLD